MNSSRPLVLFDGICNFCNYWVNFAIRHNKKKNLDFAPLQGEHAKKLLSGFNFNVKDINTVILVENGKVYTQSSAAFRIARHLSGGWKLIYGLLIIPRFIRDWLYNIVAANRYRWFGKKETCMIPPPEVRARFFD